MDNNALVKAIGVGVAVFVVTMLIFWGIARVSGMTISFPKKTVSDTATPFVVTPPFLK